MYQDKKEARIRSGRVRTIVYKKLSRYYDDYRTNNPQKNQFLGTDVILAAVAKNWTNIQNENHNRYRTLNSNGR